MSTASRYNTEALVKGLLEHESNQQDWESVKDSLLSGDYARMDGLPKVVNMIFDRAHYYARLTGLPLEDLVQEAFLACIEAGLTYDPSRGTKLITWQWWQIDRRIKRFRGSRKKIAATMFAEDLPELPEPGISPTEFYEFMDGAPPDVVTVCSTVLDHAQQYAGFKRTHCIHQIEKSLRRKGWTRDRAKKAIRATKIWFANRQPAMLRNKAPGTTRSCPRCNTQIVNTRTHQCHECLFSITEGKVITA